MTFDVNRLTTGMEVVGLAGDVVGSVKQVRTHDFLLERSMKRDLYVPFAAVRELGGRTVTLGIPSKDIDGQGWSQPPLLGGPTESDSTAPKSDQVVGTGDPAERDSWSADSDAYTLEPLDTRDARLATQGIDDGEGLREEDRMRATPTEPPAKATPQARRVSETDRLRDLFG